MVVWNASAEVPVRSKVSVIDLARVEYARQLQADAAKQRQLELRQAAARTMAHAKMPSTMYASTPSDPNQVPHALPGLASGSDSVVDLVMPRYLESVAEAESRSISQRWERVLRTIRTVEQSQGHRNLSRSPLQPSAVLVSQSVTSQPSSSDRFVLPYFPSATDPSGRQGLVRLINHSSRVGVVTIQAIDENGMFAAPITISLDAESAVNLNAVDLEHGNPAKGLAVGAGRGQGAWVLALSSSVIIEAYAYVESPDGHLTPVIDTARKGEDGSLVTYLAEGGDANTASFLRLVNLNAVFTDVVISRFDERDSPRRSVTVELPGHHSRTYLVDELATGAAPGLSGSLDEIASHSRVSIETVPGVLVMSFSVSDAGHLTNLSGLASRDSVRSVPLFIAASDPHRRQSVLRLVNRESRAGTVSIQAFDDTGRTYEVVSLALDVNGVVEIDSNDLELGNAAKKLSGHTGGGVGDWRLELASDLDLEILTFVTTTDGVLTPMLDTVARVENRYDVGMFKAVDDSKQIGLLRLVNLGIELTHVTILGADDRGVHSGAVELTLAPSESRTLTSAELESGGEDLHGMLGDGVGEWRLAITAQAPIQVMNLISTPTGRLTNLSTAMSISSDTEETVESLFESAISPIVQGDCVTCHVAGGVAQNARLIFVGEDDPDHLTKNLNAFRAMLDGVDNGANYILNKIQGVGHPGDVRFRSDSDEFATMKRFLELLGEDVDSGPSVTVATLFDGVMLESHRQTLRRAAIVLAGRLPTDEEYASLVEADEASLRTAIRGLMEGPGFHDFLIRASNDRLLTDREFGREILPRGGFFVDYTNKIYEFINAKGGSDEGYDDAFEWIRDVNYGVARAPLELIAHVSKNDLPYTEILTADYIMANPMAAEAYGASIEFENVNDVHEFLPAEITSYYRTDESKQTRIAFDKFTILQVVDPGNLHTDFPHSGILNTNVFLLRYPTTPTNRNRARSRWTYYHFLGLDIEKSASRTTDPVALADTNNPTLHNSACTVCHSVLDPVAGAFQNYGDNGLYRNQYGGLDSLDRHYKNGRSHPYVSLEVGAESTRDEPDIVSTIRKLPAGQQEIGLHITNEVGHTNIHADYLAIHDESGEVAARVELETLGEGSRIWDGVSFEICCEVLIVPISVPSTGTYTVEASTWLGYQSEDAKGENGNLKMIFGGPFYRNGDSWYRDMRNPGFSGEISPDSENSVQWLAARIVEDERFAEATVNFWWSALMGSDVIRPPADADDADSEATLLVANAQALEIERLASGFEAGFREGSPYNLKDLLVEMSLSSWFRAETVENNERLRISALREASAGAKRLLTPAELSNKTGHLTGFQWGRHRDQSWRSPHEEKLYLLTDTERAYGLLYGDIDSDGITERARGFTSVMAGVAQSHAAETSCPIVMRELFLLEGEERLLFEDLDRRITPTRELGEIFEISAASRDDIETLSVVGKLRRGDVLVKLAYLNDYWGGRNMDRDILLDRLRILRGEEVVFELEMENHTHPDCSHIEQGAFHLSDDGPECILSIPVSIAHDDTYTVEVTAWGDQAGDELPRLAVTVESDVINSAGSIAIRTQLVELYDKLLGLHVTTESDEIRSTYELFVEVWQHNLASEHRSDDFRRWRNVECDWASDAYFLDGILEDAWLSPAPSSDGQEKRHGWDWESIGEYFETVDFSDSQGVARTWVTVMTYMLTDYRYLHL